MKRLLLPLLILSFAPQFASAQLPNPYRIEDGWAKLPDGRVTGALGGLKMDNDGKHLWAVVRCTPDAPYGQECLESDLDPILKFDLEGNVVDSFGGGLIIWPHGLDVDQDGNIWVADSVAPDNMPANGNRGQQVIKFSPQGKVLMHLGTPGVPGNDETHFNAPSDVAVLPNGDILVGDGHGTDGNNRVVKYSPDGKYLMQWGKTGYGHGEFRGVHDLAIDSRGRVFVADRSNNRIEVFDDQGKHLSTWQQFGRPSGIYFGPGDKIYVADSSSNNVSNPGFHIGIRIGDAKTGWVEEFVRWPWSDPHKTNGAAAESVAVDNDGNMYGGEPFQRVLRKYVRVQP